MKLMHTSRAMLIAGMVLALAACGGGSSSPTPAASAPTTVTPSPPAAAAWSVTGSLQTARSGHTATLLPNGKVLVAGGISMQGDGQTNPSATVYLSGVELYDPATKLWSTAAALATARSSHTASLLPNGKVLIVGGVIAGGTSASIELYDPVTNTWAMGPALATTRYKHAATLLANGKVLVTGGYDGTGGSSASVELYDPASNTWSTGGTMREARSAHAASLLPNGKVLVVGGYGDTHSQPGAELYDPTTNTWTAAARPTVAVSRGVSCTLLPNGKLLCIQGYKQNFATSDSLNAELYDPATNSWTLAGSLTTAHEEHTATVLPNGTILLVGGGYTSVHSATTYATDTTELYDPATNIWSRSNPLSVGPRLGHTATLLRDGAVLVVGGTQASGWWYQPSRANAALYTLL